MKLKNLTVIDSQFVDADILTDFGSIRVKAELMPGDLPCHIDSIHLTDDGTPWSGYTAQQVREISALIDQAGVEAVE